MPSALLSSSDGGLLLLGNPVPYGDHRLCAEAAGVVTGDAFKGRAEIRAQIQSSHHLAERTLGTSWHELNADCNRQHRSPAFGVGLYLCTDFRLPLWSCQLPARHVARTATAVSAQGSRLQAVALRAKKQWPTSGARSTDTNWIQPLS